MDGKWKITLVASARRHGFERIDALAAISRARLTADPFQASRIPSTPDPAGWIGPAVDGTEVEVFAEVDHRAREIQIFHMMEARPHIIRTIETAQKEQKR
ncbi:hypothetical protein [Microbacterium amylolyticum]|uniref:Uncharacterized protein n=1 Tax=Microbacterium amylolyticum TaxID=936337 RepID=A0ABS4ZKQ6_9MICO|nr:hypothetical protein [Microbacterium amylolyticum]MBP2437871.1 hypothetical protein [Microbacterium amylolyticum]